MAPGAALAAGASYKDPVSGVTVWKATSATVPAANSDAGHDYADGPNQASWVWGGDKHTVLARGEGMGWWLVDLQRGKGLSNWRKPPAEARPNGDLCFTFSSNPATPQIAYVTVGSKLVRFDTATGKVDNTGNFPATDWTSSCWLQQDMNDEWFVAIGDPDLGEVVAWNSKSGVTKRKTFASFDEPHFENQGRYVLILTTHQIWDLVDDKVWDTDLPGTIPTHWGHMASPRRFFPMNDVDTGGGKMPIHRYDPSMDAWTMISDFGGYQPDFHMAGQWIQAGAPDTEQYYLLSTYHEWSGGGGYLIEALGLVRLDGADVRLIGHHYTQGDEYWRTPRATISPDGELVLFDSDMGGPRADLFIAELPL